MSSRSNAAMRVWVVILDDVGAPAEDLEHLQRQGHDVVVFAADRPAAEVRWIQTPAAAAGPGRRALALARLLTRSVGTPPPDITWVRAGRASGTLAAVTARFSPAVLEVVRPVLDDLRDTASLLQVEAGRQLLAAAARAVQALFTPAHRVRQHLEAELGASGIQVLDDGIPLDALPLASSDDARRMLSLPPDVRFVSVTGPLRPPFRLDLLALAHRRVAGCGLLVVGEGPELSRVYAMAAATRPSSPVIYLGGETDDARAAALLAADVGLGLDPTGPAPALFQLSAVGRRQVSLPAPGLESVAALYPTDRALFVAQEASAPALQAAIEAALDAERTEGPLPEASVQQARAKLAPRAVRLEAILTRCASRS